VCSPQCWEETILLFCSQQKSLGMKQETWRCNLQRRVKIQWHGSCDQSCGSKDHFKTLQPYLEKTTVAGHKRFVTCPLSVFWGDKYTTIEYTHHFV
jgi:hypothetical protein